jgi:large conductance mechanosensitive channel
MVKDFKEFILRGNVVDLAVGIVIGTAFAVVVGSLVRDILTPIIAIPGSVDFSELDVEISGSNIRYGEFLNAVIAFLLVAAALFFFVVRPVNALMERRRTETDVATRTKECPHCLSSIPEVASVCAFCTRDTPTVA